jgi:hypothetical protein
VIQVRSVTPEDKAYELGRGSYVLEVTQMMPPRLQDVFAGMQTWRDPIGLDAKQLAFGQAVGIRPQIRAHRRWRHLSFHAFVSSL